MTTSNLRYLVVCAVLLGLICVASGAVADQLVINGGFESPTIAPWHVTGDVDLYTGGVAHSGAKWLDLNGEGAGTISQNLPTWAPSLSTSRLTGALITWAG